MSGAATEGVIYESECVELVAFSAVVLTRHFSKFVGPDTRQFKVPIPMAGVECGGEN